LARSASWRSILYPTAGSWHAVAAPGYSPAVEFLLPFLVALAVSLVGTPLAMRLARRLGAVARPRSDRWSQRPTPLLGGIAIYTAFTAALALFAPMSRDVAGLMAAGGAIFALGLVDDLKSLRPSVKLAGQVAAACLLIPFGVHAIFVIHPVVAIPATLFWIVAVTNAFNLLDNMDGLSSGVGFISSGFMFAVALEVDQPVVATAAAGLAGATLGFLVFNFNPARVFMGDSGSLFLGFTLSSLTIMGTWHEASNLFLVLLVPLLVLAVPLFDTALVTVLRKLSGRAVSQGGRDHSSHRLVALGLSERQAVLVLYLACVGFGGLAVLGLTLDLYVTALVVGLLLVLVLLFGVFLAEAKVYGDVRRSWELAHDPSSLLGRVLINKWLILELSGDLVLISVAYLAAYQIRFELRVPEDALQQIHQLLPIVLPIQIASLVFFGVYQEQWRYGGLSANFRIVKAVLVGTALSYGAVRLLTSFTFYSRAVFVIAALGLTLLIMGSRSVVRLWREWVAARRAGGRRALVVGAGDAAQRVVQELRWHPGLGMRAVALVDDDPAKHGRRVHGVPVVGHCGEIPDVAERVGAEVILFAIPSATPADRRRILDACARAGIPYQIALGAHEIVGRGGEGVARAVGLGDLLLRARLRVGEREIEAAVRGRSLVVVGVQSAAAAELVRAAASLGARHLVLADSDAAALVRLRESLARAGAGAVVQTRLVHLSDEGSLARVLREARPDIVVMTSTLRTEVAATLDPPGALERNFLAVAAAARQSAAAGVRVFALWSWSELTGVAAASLRLGELAAAALGPPRVAVLRAPAVVEDPDHPLGEALRAVALGEAPPILPPEQRVRLALGSEVALFTLYGLTGETTSEVLYLAVPDEPLGALVEMALRHVQRASAPPAAPAATSSDLTPPAIERLPLPRPAVSQVEAVERQVREALAGGRLDDALAAASLLVPAGDEGEGGMIALDAARRSV
jgi:UDP-GlcNAc:undecaprenyl-phosphate GlcNAc-1-phosphate transferase